MISFQNIFDLFYENLFPFTVLFVFIILFRYFIRSYVIGSQLPAGPTGLPIVGYIPFLGREPHKSIAKLSEKYGNVFTLKLWFKNVVILNDFHSIKDAFTKDSLSGRPDPHFFSYINNSPSLTDDSGQVWREHRRFSMQLMRDLGSGKGSMEDRINEEIDYLIKRIEKNSGQPINIGAMLIPSMSNNISHLVFGHRFDENDPKRKILDESIIGFSSTLNPIGLIATSPVWLAKLVLKLGVAGDTKAYKNNVDILSKEVAEHIEHFDENNKRDYMDGYLAQMKTRKNNDPNNSFTMDKLIANSFTFFGAGSETVRTSTDWAILFAAHHSEYQQKIQAEIDSVAGTERSVTWADRVLMPFTQAFICEVFRLKPAVPINLYRRALEDTHILNHFIPKDTLVLANFWAIHNDCKLWKNPDQFNPYRFLSNDGKQLIKTEYLVPFSIGKRACAGEALARSELFLYFTSLLQKFSITGVEGKVISFEEQFGLSLQPKYESLLMFKTRV